MIDLLRRMFERPGLLVALIICSLLLNVLALASPLFVIQVLNRYVSYGVDSTLATLTIGASFAVVLEFGFRQVRMRFASVVAARSNEIQSLENFHFLTRVKLAAVENIPTGLRREFLSGSDAIAQAHSAPNVTTLLDFPFALLFLGVLFLLSPPLALIAALFAGGVWLAAMVSGSGLKTAATEAIQKAGEGQRHVGSLISAADSVRAFNARAYLVHAWNVHLRGFQALARRIAAKRGFIQSVTQSAAAAMSIAIIAAGAVLVVNQELDVGALIGANILAARALASVSRFVMLAEPMARAKQAAQLMREFHKLPQELAQGSALGEYQGSVSFKDVAIVYPGASTPLIESLNLELQPGTVLLVCGANGSGKTTLCKLLAGLLEPTRGDVLADGVSLRQIVPEWWHRQVCYLPQEPTLLNASVRDNLTTVRDSVDDDAINQAITAAGLTAFFAERNDGYKMMIIDNGANLSLGIRRRLALARALIADGRLVVFDEPTEGLDAEGRAAVYAVLNRMSQEGRTIIVASDDPYIAQAAQASLDLDHKPTPVLHTRAPESQGTAEGPGLGSQEAAS